LQKFHRRTGFSHSGEEHFVGGLNLFWNVGDSKIYAQSLKRERHGLNITCIVFDKR
jgi:hypothetical protein